jgi:poly(3-hydroxybutyrate) depolymerase
MGGGGDDAGDGGNTPSSADGAAPSVGCGSAAPQALAQYVTYSIHATGATLDPIFRATPYDRGYAVWLPPSYDSSVPHRTVFIASGCGSIATTENRYMTTDLNGGRSNIYVGLASPPLSVNAQGCTDNTGAKSTEWEFFALVTAAVERSFCVDKNQEIVAGTASGSTLANMLGCYFSGIDQTRVFRPDLALRAQFSVAGAAPMALPPCAGPVAAFWMHDINEFIPVTDSLMSRDRVLAANGCTATPAEDWGVGKLAGIGCKKYSSCPSEHPVVFCETVNQGRQANYYDLLAPAMDQFLLELSTPP